MKYARTILAVFLFLLFLFALIGERPFSAHFAYYYDILINIGINIILAVSLNLVNGYTGQFSLGHAGFMAVGAYAAGSWADHLSPGLINFIAGPNGVLTFVLKPFPILQPLGLPTVLADNAALVVATLFGGLLAAGGRLAGWDPLLRVGGGCLGIVRLRVAESLLTRLLTDYFLGGALGKS